MENLDPPPPPPPKSRMGEWRVFAFRAASSLIWWGWRFAVPFYFVQDSILDKINGKPSSPLPPNQGWENGAFLPFARIILDLGGDGGLLFHFILSKIVGSTKEGKRTKKFHLVKRGYSLRTQTYFRSSLLSTGNTSASQAREDSTTQKNGYTPLPHFP